MFWKSPHNKNVNIVTALVKGPISATKPLTDINYSGLEVLIDVFLVFHFIPALFPDLEPG